MHIEQPSMPSPKEGVENGNQESKKGPNINPEEITELIKRAGNFGELYGALREIGGLQGSHTWYGASQLIEIIDAVRGGRLSLNYITRTGGLRSKVEELLQEREEDKRRKEGSIGNLTPEKIAESNKKGEPIVVRVRRSSGKIEEGWVVIRSDGNNAVVVKYDEERRTLMRKVVPLEELQELNK